jgi:RNA polymerase sigma-70 factor, ECF subfamily
MEMVPPSNRPLPAESEILPGLKAGEQAAFEAFVRLFCDPMYYVARRLLRNDEDAREVMQDAFLQAFRAMDQFEGRAQLSTWLHRIVINASLKKLQANQRSSHASIEHLLPHFGEDEHHLDDIGDFGVLQSSVEELVSRKELREIVHKRIQDLPDAYRTVILLRDIEGLSTEETATILETSLLVVKTRLHRARQALRTLLEPTVRDWGREGGIL